MNAALFEPKPRWPGAPPICLETNLPAFPTMKALDAYLTKYSPRAKVKRKGKCKTCDHYHADATISRKE
jgi:hypothetical protein